MQKKWFYLILFITANVAVFYVTPIMFSFKVDAFPFFYFLLRAFLLVYALFLLPFLFNDFIKNKSANPKSSWIAVLLVFLIFFYIIELFLTYYPETNGKNDTYCSKTWMYYYWKTNKYGYRDCDFDSMTLNRKSIIAFAGDSYTEGHGIKNPEDRVSNLCRKAFPDYNIYNLGWNGVDINFETNLIVNLPIHPQVVVLQICANDWDYLYQPIHSANKMKNILLAESGSLSITAHSILFNYLNSKLGNVMDKVFTYQLNDNEMQKVYTTFNINKSVKINSRNNLTVLEYAAAHANMPEDSVEARLFSMFKEFNSSLLVMTDTALFSNYLNKLTDLNTFCNQHNTALVVVPYPNLDKFSMLVSNKYINRYLCSLIKKRGINCLDIFDRLKKADLTSYTVNMSDNHINVEASKIVADTLISYLHTEILKK